MPRDDKPESSSDRSPRRGSGERTGRPARPFVKGSRPPRPAGAGDRPDRPRRSSSDRSDRPARSFDRDRAPRRSSSDRSDRPDRPRRDSSDRPARSFDRDRAPRRDSSDRPDRPRRSSSDRSDRPSRPRRDEGPDTRSTAQQKSDDVARRTGGRRYGTDPYPPTTHKRESWKDEGSTRKSSSGPRTSSKRSSRHEDDDDRIMTVSIKNVEAVDANKIKEQLGSTADRAIERLARSLHAFEAHRYSEARKLIMPLLPKVSGIAIVHEVAGLSMYRLGRWQDAADQLEIARGIAAGEVTNHPVLADCYRALRRYEKVTELWESLKLMSPPAGLLAEGRIVAAGALADQGELQAAVRMMTHGTSDPHKVQEHHLREWYVLADLYDRAGDVASARRLFVKIQSSEPKFADVADRLNTLGE